MDGPERQRKIIHIDMDAFYASVEQRDNLELRGKPVAVGGSRERGVVAAASYEARKFGVRSAMPSVTAKRKCPELTFVKPRFDVYRAVSHQIRAVFAKYTPFIEPLSLDEAYFDVTENLKAMPSATEIAEEVRARIRSETGLTASAGVSYNKFLAKMASDERKPDGLFVITPNMGPAFVESLPVGKFHGIGPVTAAKMEGLGIHNGGDLIRIPERKCALSDPESPIANSSPETIGNRKSSIWNTNRIPGLRMRGQTLEFLQQHFGKAGPYYFSLARGIDDRPVWADRVRKSIGAETTFNVDIFTAEEAHVAIDPLIARVWSCCEASTIRGRTTTLKAKYADFQQITRSRTVEVPVASRAVLEELVSALLDPLFPVSKGIRLLGVTISSLDVQPGPRTGQQLWLPLSIELTGLRCDWRLTLAGCSAASVLRFRHFVGGLIRSLLA